MGDTKSTGAYSPEKALAHPDRLAELRAGRQPYPVHLHLILSDLCDLDCPTCFLPGTPVTLHDSTEAPIETLARGMSVIADDGHDYRVTATMRRLYDGEIIVVHTGHGWGPAVAVTPEHEFKRGEGWCAAQDLQVDDQIWRFTHGAFVESHVVKIERRHYTGYVYNIEVERRHTYVAGGLLVHNCAYRWSGYSSNEMFGENTAKGYQHNPNRMLDFDLVKSVLDDCKAMGVAACETTGGGEPTLHPQAREIMEYAQSLDLDTALITNGLHLDRMGESAVKTKWLRISVDAATAATYAKVRPAYAGTDRTKALANVARSEKNFAKVVDAFRRVVEMRDRLGTDCLIGFGFVVQKDNWHEIPGAVRLAYALGVDNVRLSGVFSPEGADYHAEYREKAEALEREAVAEFDHLSRIICHGPNEHGAKIVTPAREFRVFGRFHEKMEDLSARPDYPDCWYQHLTTYLGGDGNLYRCCVTSYSRQGLIGNVKDAGGFKKLWESKMKHFKFEKFDARSCKLCQFSDRIKAINAAVKSEKLPDEPPGLVHKNFV